jgi:hypothetical protein
MRKESHYIDNIFKESLGNTESLPPFDAWVNISHELDRKKRRGMVGLYMGLAASFALLIGVGSLYFGSYSINETKSVVLAKSNRIATNKQSIALSGVSPVVSAANTSTNSTDEKFSKQLESASEPNQVITENSAKIASEEKTSIAKASEKNTTTQDFIEHKETLVDSVSVVQNIPNKTEKENKTGVLVDAQKTQNSTSDFLSKRNRELFVEEELPSQVKIQPKQIQTVSKEDDKKKDQFKEPKKHLWSVECQAAPMYSYRNINKVSTNLPGESGFNQNEEPLMTYAGGFKVSYETSSRLSIQSGVFYSVYGQQVNTVYEQSYSTSSNVVMANVVDDTPQKIITNASFGAVTTNMETRANSMAEVTTIVENSKLVQQFKYIEIPLLARYKLIDRRISCHVVGGLSTNFLVDNKSIFEGNGTKTESNTDNIRTVNYSSTLGVGFNYSIFPQVNLSLEPTCKYYLNSISTNSQVKVHPYAFGIFTGLIYHF